MPCSAARDNARSPLREISSARSVLVNEVVPRQLQLGRGGSDSQYTRPHHPETAEAE